MFAEHLQRRFRDPGWTPVRAAGLLARWESAAAASRVDGFALRLPGPDGLRQARDALRVTAAPGKDRVPVGLLLVLSPITLNEIQRAFDRRLLGFDPSPVEEWRSDLTIVLPKPGKDHCRAAGWRPISLVGAVAKWYESYLWVALLPYLRPLPACLVGFCAGRQTLEICSFLQLALSRSAEWRMPLYIASLDIEGAFDAMRLEHVAPAIAARGAPPQLVAAIVREQLDQRSTPCVASRHGGSFVRERGCRQGAPRTPALWNHFLAGPMERLTQRWQDRGPSVAWSAEFSRFPLLVWADNFYVIASDAAELHRRVNELAEALQAISLAFSTDSLEVLVGEAAPALSAPLSLTRTDQPFRVVPALRVLGTLLDSRGSTRTMAAHRLREAQKVWARTRHLLCAQCLPPALRVKRFYQTVGASALYGAGLWTPNATLFRILEGQELRWMRAMTGLRKAPGEEWIPFHRRRRSAAEALRDSQGRWTLWHRACHSVHGLFGHLSRHQDLPAGAALGWRGADWWRIVQELHDAGTESDGTWRHPHRNWVRAADTSLVTFHGADWRAKAAQRREWTALGGR